MCSASPRSQLLGGFAGDFSPKGFRMPTFPQVSGIRAAQHPQKTTQKSEPMAKSAPIFCKTVQKSQGMGACEEEGVAAHARPPALRKRRCEQGTEVCSERTPLRPLFTKRHPYWRLRNYPDRLSGHVSIISNTRNICNARQPPASPAIHVIARIAAADNHLSSRSPRS